MRIAHIAHDDKKQAMLALAGEHRALLARHALVGTGTSARRLFAGRAPNRGDL